MHTYYGFLIQHKIKYKISFFTVHFIKFINISSFGMKNVKPT